MAARPDNLLRAADNAAHVGAELLHAAAAAEPRGGGSDGVDGRGQMGHRGAGCQPVDRLQDDFELQRHRSACLLPFFLRSHPSARADQKNSSAGRQARQSGGMPKQPAMTSSQSLQSSGQRA